VRDITSELLERIKADPEFAELVAEQLRGTRAFFAVSSEELIASEETFEVEFKSTARWNLREGCRDKRMEDAVVKTVAGFLNTDGGTLFVGVADDGRVIGLEHDLSIVKAQSADGFLNWVTTHLINALTHAAVMRTRARIEHLDGGQICRIDVASSSIPVKARMSDGNETFWVRMNNSTRGLPEVEVAQYVRDRWG
jgi:type I restriction enzyme R subunit